MLAILHISFVWCYLPAIGCASCNIISSNKLRLGNKLIDPGIRYFDRISFWDIVQYISKPSFLFNSRRVVFRKLCKCLLLPASISNICGLENIRNCANMKNDKNKWLESRRKNEILNLASSTEEQLQWVNYIYNLHIISTSEYKGLRYGKAKVLSILWITDISQIFQMREITNKILFYSK